MVIKCFLKPSPLLFFSICQVGIRANGRNKRFYIGQTRPGSNSHSANHSCVPMATIPLCSVPSPEQWARQTWNVERDDMDVKSPASYQHRGGIDEMHVPEAGEQVDSPGPCVPSHHPAPTRLSKRIFLLALASRYRRSPSWGEKQGQTMVQMGQ